MKATLTVLYSFCTAVRPSFGKPQFCGNKLDAEGQRTGICKNCRVEAQGKSA